MLNRLLLFKLKLILLVSLLPCLIKAQEAGFFVNQKYINHLEANKTTGKAEVAFFALDIELQDTCLFIKQYQRIDSNRHIYPSRFLKEAYYWQDDLKRYLAPCKRAKSKGLLRHQHTEGENWLVFEADPKFIVLKRCGWARSENQFIKADASRFFRKN